MDFNDRTAEELLALLPPAEDDRWELKSSTYLKPEKKGELKRELGKQVSAFANSGGGFIVFGVNDNTRYLEPCMEKVGRQSMVDFLSNLVEQSVEQPIINFKIHRIPFDTEPTNAIFLIQIPDSPAAPHQAKDERQYYYRIFGHSKPAPHFHLELLRQRQTSCIVVPKIESVVASLPGLVRRKDALTFDVVVSVKNQATFVAKPVGVAISCSLPTENWSIGSSENNDKDHVITAEYLFPGLVKHFRFKVTYSIPRDQPVPVDKIISDLPDVILFVRAFSQNFGSESVEIVLTKYTSADELTERNKANEELEKEIKESMKHKIEKLKPQLESGMRHLERIIPNLPKFNNPTSE